MFFLTYRFWNFTLLIITDTLMDELCRTRYIDLYLFKKTLEEFDEPELASLVPVRKIDE